MSYWIVDGQQLTNEQYEELQRQKRLEEKNIRQESERLSRQLSQAYAALKEHLERNPETSQEITDEQELEQQIYYNLRRNCTGPTKLRDACGCARTGLSAGLPE